MARTTIMSVSKRDLASRAAVLAVSALAHVLVYGALSLVPASTPPPRTRLIVTELIVAEPAPPPAPVPVRPVTPPRPLVREKQRAKPAEVAASTKPTAPSTPTHIEPVIEREASAPIDAAPQIDAAPPLPSPAETPREVATAPSPTRTPSSSVSAMPSASSSSSGPMFTAARTGSAAIVAALPPGAPAVASAVTRTAIPRGGYQVTPSYPATARRLGIEGTALLRVFVDARGHVSDIVVKQSAGHPDLDRAATDAVRRWRFDPARRGVDAVAMWVDLPVEFHLR
jgi:protein TonB